MCFIDLCFAVNLLILGVLGSCGCVFLFVYFGV